MSDNGGAAFSYNEKNHDGSHYFSNDGMSLRDYFAAHCDQPGVLEIATAAGLHCADNFWVINPSGEKQKFTAWYEALSQSARFELQAKVRFQMADAMIAARQVVA